MKTEFMKYILKKSQKNKRKYSYLNITFIDKYEKFTFVHLFKQTSKQATNSFYERNIKSTNKEQKLKFLVNKIEFQKFEIKTRKVNKT